MRLTIRNEYKKEMLYLLYDILKINLRMKVIGKQIIFVKQKAFKVGEKNHET